MSVQPERTGSRLLILFAPAQNILENPTLPGRLQRTISVKISWKPSTEIWTIFYEPMGGETLYDNYKVIINEHVGGDYGTELRYGKNIPSDGIKETIDMSGVVTRIYPKAFNGHALSGSGYVDSPNIDAYPVAMCSELQFEDVKMREDAQEDDEKNGVVICDTQAELDNALSKNAGYSSAGIDKPKVSISADMILLQDTDQYKDYKILESVSLGDTIHCKHSKLGIVTDARVIALEYDCIQKRVTSVELGDFKNDYFDRVTSSTGKVESIINPDGTIMAEKVQGILNGIYTQLKLQSTVAQKEKGRAFTIEDLDPDSPLYGCMTWGTQASGSQPKGQQTVEIGTGRQQLQHKALLRMRLLQGFFRIKPAGTTGIWTPENSGYLQMRLR